MRGCAAVLGRGSTMFCCVCYWIPLWARQVVNLSAHSSKRHQKHLICIQVATTIHKSSSNVNVIRCVHINFLWLYITPPKRCCKVCYWSTKAKKMLIRSEIAPYWTICWYTICFVSLIVLQIDTRELMCKKFYCAPAQLTTDPYSSFFSHLAVAARNVSYEALIT